VGAAVDPGPPFGPARPPHAASRRLRITRRTRDVHRCPVSHFCPACRSPRSSQVRGRPASWLANPLAESNGCCRAGTTASSLRRVGLPRPHARRVRWSSRRSASAPRSRRLQTISLGTGLSCVTDQPVAGQSLPSVVREKPSSTGSDSSLGHITGTGCRVGLPLSGGLAGPRRSTSAHLNGPYALLVARGIHARCHVSTTVVSTALAGESCSYRLTPASAAA
jgi:hypothetical protein